ncbi:MAG: hypothetical protein QXQ90_08790 [Desulfurococcaceae archaeon]
MKLEKKHLPEIDVTKLPDYKIKDLLNVDHNLIRYRIQAHIRILEREERMLEDEVRRLSGDAGKAYGKDYIESLSKKLDNTRKKLEFLRKVRDEDKVGILETLRSIEEELAQKNKELWDAIMELRFKDLLSFNGDPADKLALYNFLTSIFKGVSIEIKLEAKHAERTESVSDQQKVQLPSESTLVVDERSYISLSTEEWINMLNKCFAEKKQLELPENYLAENMRRPLRNLITAMLEVPPEKLRYVFSKKYKYLLEVHSILYTILKENKRYTVTPGSSTREYIEGEGGIFSVFPTHLVGEETTSNTRRRICRIKIGEREYTIVREIVLEDNRAKQINYMVSS